MPNLSIGITGINAAQRGIDVVGNNIANAATEGYHRQEINFKPAATVKFGGFVYGQGVEIRDIYRVVDTLLNSEMIRHQASLSQYDKELTGLQTIETSFSELNSNSLSKILDDFFNAIDEFSKQPQSQIYENKVTSIAVLLCDRLNTMGKLIDSIDESSLTEAKSIVNRFNELAENYAYLNSQIVSIESGDVKANGLRSERDQLLNQMAKLMPITTVANADGSTNVFVSSSGSIAVVSGSQTIDLSIEKMADSQIGLRIDGMGNVSKSVSGGIVGGLLQLTNQYTAELRGQLNELSSTLIREFNRIHLQGVGTDGSFTELNGTSVSEDTLGNWPDITVPGKIYVRITDTATSEVNRYSIDVTASDTVSTIVAKLNGSSVPGLSATLANSTVKLRADTGYKFDFMPGVIPTPIIDPVITSIVPTISGIYTGDTNQLYTCTVSGTGMIGVTAGLTLEVKNADGDTVENINIGNGYVAGTAVECDSGIKIAIAAGPVNNGESFGIRALANSDETGFLAAAGLNTFFNGDGAGTIKVSQDLLNGTRKVCASIGQDKIDNENLRKLHDLYSEKITSLGNRNIKQYYQNIATGLGQKVQIIELKKSGTEAILKNLSEKQEQLSGVDINTEATKMMIFEQMFQAMSQYLSVCKDVMDEMVSILR